MKHLKSESESCSSNSNLSESGYDDEDDFVSFEFDNQIINIYYSHLSKYSGLIRKEYLLSDVRYRLPQELTSFQKQFDIKSETIILFFKLLQKDFKIDENDKFTFIQYDEFFKISEFLQIKKFMKKVTDDINKHKVDIDFAIQIILYENEKSQNTKNQQICINQEIEQILSTKINDCFQNEKFAQLPIPVIHRIIEKSNKKILSADLLFDFIMKDLINYSILLLSLNIQNLSEKRVNSLFQCFSNYPNKNFFGFLNCNLDYVLNLRENVKNIQQKLLELENDRSYLRGYKIHLQDKLENNQKMLDESKRENDLIKKANSELQKSFEQLKSQSEKEKQLMQSKLNKLQNEKNLIQQMLNEKQQHYKQIQNVNIELLKKLNYLEQAKNQLEKESVLKQKQLNDYEKEKKQIQIMLNDSKQQNEQIQNTNNELQTKLNDLEQIKSKLEKDKCQLMKKKHHQQKQLDYYEKQKSQIQIMLNDTKQQNEQIQNANNELLKRVNDLEQARNQLEKESVLKQKQLNDYEKEKKQIQIMLNDSKQQNEQIQNTNNELQKKLKDLEQTNNQIEKEKRYQQKQLNDYEKTKNQIKQIKKELLEQQKKLVQMEQTNCILVQENVELQKKNDRIEEEKCKITGKIEARNKNSLVFNAEIQLIDKNMSLDKKRSKYIVSQNSSKELGSSAYEFGVPITSLNFTTIDFAGSQNTYYVRALVVDNDGKSIELVSNPITTQGSYLSFSYSGKAKEIILLKGKYMLEAWGGQGGKQTGSNAYTALGGKGGYAKGTLSLTKDTKIFIYVGGQGKGGDSRDGSFTKGAFPDGGGTITYHVEGFKTSPGTGGGSSSIRVSSDSLYSRIIVAGGGGGADGDYSFANHGGFGGGVIGGCGYSYGKMKDQGAGSQKGSSPGPKGSGCQGNSGYFGKGADGNGRKGCNSGGAGGGGWYGGGSGGIGNNWRSSSGGGGSGWAFTELNFKVWWSGDSSNAKKFLLGRNFYLTDTAIISGNSPFPCPNGKDQEIGHSGNGHVKITLL